MKKNGVVKYFEVFYQDLDNTDDTPDVLKKFIERWKKFYLRKDILDTVNARVFYMGYVKFSSLLFDYFENHYRLLPETLDLEDEQFFDAFLYEMREDLKSIGVKNILSTAMID